MEKALTAAEVEIYALLHTRIDEQEFRQRYPNLISELAELDLSLDQRLVPGQKLKPPPEKVILALFDLVAPNTDRASSTCARSLAQLNSGLVGGPTVNNMGLESPPVAPFP